MLNLNQEDRDIYTKYAVEIRQMVNSPWDQKPITIQEAINFYKQKERL